MRLFRLFTTLFSTSFLLAACGNDSGSNPQSAPLLQHSAGVSQKATVIGTTGTAIGEAFVTDGPNGFLIRISASGLSTGFHGMHLHRVGDCSDYAAGFKASSGHINPGGKSHGFLHPEGFEKADLPNIFANEHGIATMEVFAGDLLLSQALDQDGFAIVIHQNEDDHVTQPIGNSGPRVACAAFQ